MKCFNCGSEQHLKRSCPHPKGSGKGKGAEDTLITDTDYHQDFETFSHLYFLFHEYDAARSDLEAYSSMMWSLLCARQPHLASYDDWIELPGVQGSAIPIQRQHAPILSSISLFLRRVRHDFRSGRSESVSVVTDSHAESSAEIR